MLKGRPLEIESQIPIIAELERCAAWTYSTFAGDRLDVPPITIGIQTRGKKHDICGHFKADGWRTLEGDPVHEILVMSEHLFSDPHDILGTIVHETVHLFNHDRGEKDCSKGGRHNRTFRDTAQSFGLEVTSGTKGWAYTKLSPELRERLTKEFKPNLGVFRIFQESLPPKDKKEPVKKVRPWVCECPITVQVATSVQLDAHCGACDTDFRLKGE